jgi:hypothetical protein
VGWSLCTQRLELSASGMIAHTVFFLALAVLFPPLLLAPPPPLLLLPQPAAASAPAAASMAIPVNLDTVM